MIYKIKKSSKYILMMVLLISAGCKVENNPPTITIVHVTPEIIEVGEVATVSVIAQDLDNDIMSFDYVVTGGYLADYGSVVEWTAPQVTGAYTITVTVTDGRGGSAVGTGSLIVVQAPTRIRGNVTLPEGTIGDLGDAVARIYTSWENWLDGIFVESVELTSNGVSGSFVFEDIEPGSYILDIWSDNDNNKIWSVGDYVGWYGSGGFEDIDFTTIEVEEGQTISIEVEMLVI